MIDDITKDFVDLVFEGKIKNLLLAKYIAKFCLYISIFAIIASGASAVFLWASQGLSSLWVLLAFSFLIFIISIAVIIFSNDKIKSADNEFSNRIAEAFSILKINEDKEDLMIRIIEKEIDAGNSLVQNLSNTLFSISLTIGVSLLSSWVSDYILRQNDLNNDVSYYIFAVGISSIVFSIILAIYFSITSVWTVEKKKRLVFFYYKNQLNK